MHFKTQTLASAGIFKNNNTNQMNFNDIGKISWKELLAEFVWVI